MIKICTYVGTTLCTILFFLATAWGQNNKPVQVIMGVATTSHQPIVININQVLSDPDGDRMFINTAYTQYNANGFVAVLSDTTLRYSPINYICGPGMLRFSACDTSLVYNNSKCDTFILNVDDECTWTPLVVNVQPQADTVCNQTGHGYAVAPSGGSGIYRYELTSTNPLDIAMPNSTSVIYNGWGDRSLMLKVVDELSGDSIEGVLLANIYVHRNYEGYIDTDTTFHSGMRFIVQQQLQPQDFGHSISWWNADTILMQSTSTDPGLAQQYVDQAMIFCPDTSGFYFISLHDFHTNCVYYAEAYYTGINHPLNNEAYSWPPYYTSSNGQPLHIDNYLVEPYGYCVERIRYTDIVTSPLHGTISYIDGEMYYTPNGSCGVDTFLAIGCDTSKYLPHSTCDTIMVTVDVSCEISAQTIVTQNMACYGDDSSGTIVVLVQGDNIDPSDLTYLWSNGATNDTITGLAEGTYTVTVTYSGTVSVTAMATVWQPQPFVGNVNVVNPCGPTCSGSITSILTGGTTPYTYIWSNGSTANGLQNLCAGMWYNATVTDMNGCSVSLNANIVEETSGIVVSLTKHDIDCDSTQGYIAASVNGGVAPYNYIWSTGNSLQSINGLQTGTYSVTVTDATGCVTTATETILNLSGLSVTMADSTLPSCMGVNNGYARVVPNGGVAPYIYTWSGSTSVTDIASNLSAGSNSVTVTDNGGCSYVHQFYLAPQYVLGFNDSIVGAACIPGQLGTVLARTANGTTPYTYEWSTGATTAAISVNAGTYQYTVTDAVGCVGHNTATVSNYSLFVSAYAYPENCEQVNGRLNVGAYNGTPPYSYLWNNNPVLNSNTHNNLSNGNYTVKVTDSNGCYITASVTIEDDCHSVIAGNIYIDVNGNCLRDTGEMQQTSAMIVKASNGTHDYYGNINQYGVYNVMVYDTGVFSITIGPLACYSVCNVTPVYVAAFNQTYNIPQVGIIPSSTSHNFSAHLTGNGFNPGFNATYYVSATSYSNPNNISGTITLTYDPELIFASAPAGGVVDLNAQTVTWTNVTIPTSPGFINLSATFVLPIATPIGTLLHTTLHIAPDSNDCNPQNNSITITRPVTGSYDPNMKVANPATEILETDSVLHYTIHFQNTGNDTTHFIILKDTLSDLVDPASFEFGGSSHQPCRYEVSGTGILTFTFDPIYLPDSATNEEGSKGFVNYSIKKKATTEIGEVIRNTAHIYFDFNPAIVTNTTENEVTTLVSIRDVKANGSLTAKVYPNPFNETATIELSEKLTDAKLVITNLAGQVLQQYNNENGSKWLISKEGLSQGMYTFTVYSGGIVKIRGKLIAE